MLLNSIKISNCTTYYDLKCNEFIFNHTYSNPSNAIYNVTTLKLKLLILIYNLIIFPISKINYNLNISKKYVL